MFENYSKVFLVSEEGLRDLIWHLVSSYNDYIKIHTENNLSFMDFDDYISYEFDNYLNDNGVNGFVLIDGCNVTKIFNSSKFIDSIENLYNSSLKKVYYSLTNLQNKND